MARIVRASAAITKEKRPRGYQDFTRDKMDAIMWKPLSAEDYEKADRIMLLMMQPQVKTLLDSQPVGKKKAKNVQQGMSTLPEEFINRPIIGPDNSTNLASLSPFRYEGVYYTQGRFDKQLERVLGTANSPFFLLRVN